MARLKKAQNPEVEDMRDELRDVDTILADLEIEPDEVKSFDITDDFGVRHYWLEGGGMEWRGFDDVKDAEEYAVAVVAQDLEMEPSLFNQSFLKNHLYMTETDKRVFATEEADNYVDEVLDEAEVVRKADMEEKYEDALEKGATRLEEQIVEEAKDEVSSQYKDDIYERLEDPVEYFVEDEMMFSMDELMNQSFIQIDIPEAAKDAVDTDGIAHFIAPYDNEMVESADDTVWFRHN